MSENAAKLFDKIIIPIRKTARRLGYTIAVHGSLKRDVDLVAIPWTNEAADQFLLANSLIRELHRICGIAVVTNDYTADPFDYLKHNPQPKPHGRLGWSIKVGGGSYVDLSVMPIARGVQP